MDEKPPADVEGIIDKLSGIALDATDDTTKDTSDATSQHTVPGGKAWGVYVDHAMLIPSLILLRPRSEHPSAAEAKLEAFLELIPSLRALLDQLSPDELNSYLPYTIAVSLIVPLIVETKRPATRHPKDIETYVRGLSYLLFQAQEQAYKQTHCLFSTREKYDSQDAVMIIAASGHWWSFRIATRKEFAGEKFDMKNYSEAFPSIPVGEFDEPTGVPTSEQLFAAWKAGVVLYHKTSADGEKPTIEQNRKLQEAHKRASASAREDRLKARDQRKAERAGRERARVNTTATKEAEDQLELLNSQTSGTHGLHMLSFDDQDLDEVWKILSVVDRSLNPNSSSFVNDLLPDEYCKLAKPAWTRPMRLGTSISDKYLAYIQRQLDDMARVERIRQAETA